MQQESKGLLVRSTEREGQAVRGGRAGYIHTVIDFDKFTVHTVVKNSLKF